jgi:hypothetical protein
MRYSFRPSRYEGDRASIELLLQYKAGQFLGPGTGGNDSFHGPVVGVVLRF